MRESHQFWKDEGNLIDNTARQGLENSTQKIIGSRTACEIFKGINMKEFAKDLIQSWLRKSSGYFFDRWLFDQQIPVQALPKTIFDYEHTAFGEDQFYSPKPAPMDLLKDAPQLRSMYTPQVLPRPYHYMVENAILSGCEILDPARPKRQIIETFPESTRIQDGIDFPALIRNNYRLRQAAKTIKPEFETGFLISGYWWKNYYHFLVDCCLRYNLLREMGIVDNETKLFVHQNPTKWQMEYFSKIGIKEEQIINTEKRAVQVRNLIVGSPCRNRFLVSKGAIDCLRSTLNLTSAKQDRKLYLSRRYDDTRRVINDEEVSSTLAKYGYETVFSRELSVEDQINLFSQTKFIVAPHGAALSNIIFGKNIDLLELFPEDDWKLGFFVVLANVLDFNYTPFVCKKENNKSDYYVNVEKLVEIIHKRDLC